MSMKVVDIDLNLIEQNENSRVVYKESDLSELMASMKEDGLLQPIGVRVIKDGKFDCTFGNRRLMAAKKLGWVKIAASIQEKMSDKDRDIIGLIENLKRQNTSVSEDGRMFQKLLDYGLNRKEIAVRLGVSENRVETALDVFNQFPDELKKNIVNTGHGAKTKPGTVSASMAFHINNTRKSQGLNRSETRKLIHYAAQGGVNMAQIASIAPLMKSGLSIQKAIETVEKIQVLTIQVMISGTEITKLEKKHKKTIHNLMYDVLEDNFNLERVGSRMSGAHLKSDQFKPSRTG